MLAPHAPVVRRDLHEVQVGLDPDTAVVLVGVGFAELLAKLDGTTRTDVVLAAAGAAGLAHRAAVATLRLLSESGLVVEGRPAPQPAPTRAIRLLGAGRIGREIAALLAAADGVDRLYVFDENVPDRDIYPAAGVLPTRSAALTSQLADTAPGVLQAVSHWTKPHRPVDLTILAPDGPEVDRAITDHLVRGDEPHLLVRTLGRSACVGPLVLPGRTSCLQCHDLARRDSDPQWPMVLDQLCRIELPTSAVVATWAAATATAQALAYLNGEPAELESCTYELGEPEYAIRLRAWPAHPACGCTWPGPTQWAHE
jgi:hypothetical protein